jgi:hypothetical protein
MNSLLLIQSKGYLKKFIMELTWFAFEQKVFEGIKEE